MAEVLGGENRFGFGDMHISQLAAAPIVLEAIDIFKKSQDQKKDGLEAVYGTDVISLRRGLCLPAATCACLNGVYGERKFDEESIAQMYTFLLPFHGASARDPVTNKAYEKGWSVVTPEGDMYYHAICFWVDHVTKGKISAIPIVGYDNLRNIAQIVGDTDTTVALSLDNSFVLDWVLKTEEETGIKFVETGKDGQILFNAGELGKKPFQNGRHVVAMLDYDSVNNMILISDSFALPGMRLEHTMRWWSVDEVEKYTEYKSGVPARAIVFTKNGQKHELFEDAVDKFKKGVAKPEVV